MEPNAPCYFTPGGGVWIKGKVVEYDAILGVAVCEGGGVVEEVAVGNIRPGGETADVEDLVDIPAPHEGNLHEAVERSVQAGREVIRDGRVTIFVNPGAHLDKYLPGNVVAAPGYTYPHLWEVPERSVSDLQATGLDQFIVPMGVSGSGVTEVAKIVLRYLLKDAKDTARLTGNVGMLLECFGNGRFEGNDNSSMFQRVTEVGYDAAGAVISVKVACSNLDVDMGVLTDEHAFHAFNLLQVGSYPDMFSLPRVGDLAHAPFSTADEQVAITNTLATHLHFTEDTIHSIFSVLAAIQHIKLYLKTTQSEHTHHAATLLSLQPEPLAALCADPVAGRNLCRELYTRVFHVIVDRCNEVLRGSDGRRYGSVFVSDASGCFRSSEAGWGELVANSGYETLQREFTHTMLDGPYEKCLWEGIQLARPVYDGNSGVVALLNGVAGGGRAAVRGLARRCIGNAFYTPPAKEHEDHHLGTIHHSIGTDVLYTSELVDPDQPAASILNTSTDDFVRTLPLPALPIPFTEQLRASNPHWIRCYRPDSLHHLATTPVYPLTLMEKHGYPFSFTHRGFLARYKPIVGLSRMELGVPEVEISPARMSAKVFSPLTRYGDAGACEELIENCLVGVPYDSKVTFDKVFLMHHAYRGLEAVRARVLAGRAKIVQAWCRGWVRPVVREKLRESWGPVVEEIREAVRRVNSIKGEREDLCREGEPAARRLIEDEEVQGFVTIAEEFIDSYHRTVVLECEKAEERYRDAMKEDADADLEEILFLFTEHIAVQVQTDEMRGRALVIEEELSEAMDTAKQFYSEYIDAQMVDEQLWEESARGELEAEEADERHGIAWALAEGSKPIVIGEEEVARRGTELDEAAGWREVVEEMGFMYLEAAAEELMVEEDLGRFGYRGVGGFVFEEAREWDRITALRVPIELAYMTDLHATTHQHNEASARAAVVQTEYTDRMVLVRLHRTSLLPLQVRSMFTASLPVRRGIEEDESIDRRALCYAAAKGYIRVMVEGRGHDCEPGHRKIVEKLQRDGVRQLLAVKRQFYAVTDEERCRGVLEQLEEAQRDELSTRFLLEKHFTTTVIGTLVKFEVGKKKLHDHYRAKTYAMVESDARHDELIRRHYNTLRASAARADSIIAAYLCR